MFCLCAGLFFVGSLVLWLAGKGSVFVSPDETANAWFIQQFASQGTFRSFDALNLDLQGLVHPRSTIVISGWMMPVGFLGLSTLYGVMSALLGTSVLAFLTPACALLAVFAFRQLVKQWFDEQIANSSTIILLVHPALWYYTARGLMPNVLFVSLLVFALYAWFVGFRNRTLSVFLSGLFVGLAAFVRASEVYWIGLVCLVLIVAFWKSLTKQALVWWMVGGLLGVFPFFVMNALTYGHPFLTGYTLPVLGSEQAVSASGSVLSRWHLFPFGIDLRIVAKHVLGYGVMLFWWLSLLSLIGIVHSFFDQSFKKKSLLVYVGVFVGVAIWLGVWYGSWVIHDNPDPSQMTIANSYVRYWLPVFMLATPFAAKGIRFLADRCKTPFALPLFLLMIVVLGVNATFFSGQDGLVGVGHTLSRSLEIREAVLLRVEPESLIIVDRADKLFFPHRVLYPLRSEQTYALMKEAVARVPLYYYGITLPEADLLYLNNHKLKNLGLKIDLLTTFDEESLYQISLP